MRSKKASRGDPRRAVKLIDKDHLYGTAATLRKKGCDIVFVLPAPGNKLQVVYQTYKKTYKVKGAGKASKYRSGEQTSARN